MWSFISYFSSFSELGISEVAYSEAVKLVSTFASCF